MWTLSSTPSRRRPTPSRLALIVATILSVAVQPGPVGAQIIVYDVRNHIENALQAARQLESLANEARSLARSPYSHLVENSRSMQEMLELARTARGLSASLTALETQLSSLYPEDLEGLGFDDLLEQGRARNANARRTAEDVARAAAELERLGQGGRRRLADALAASEAAGGQTAAIQSTNQMLAALAEDLTAMRSILLAQARLLSEQAAREAADRSAGDAARQARWARTALAPPAPGFDPLGRARP